MLCNHPNWGGQHKLFIKQHQCAVIRRVLRWLKANASAKQTEDLLDRLSLAGWLRRKPAEPTGGRPVHRWSVNPILYSDAESAQSAERVSTVAPRGLSAHPALSARQS
jgi:hypothetical protein